MGQIQVQILEQNLTSKFEPNFIIIENSLTEVNKVLIIFLKLQKMLQKIEN